MPLVDFNDPAVWDALYVSYPDGVTPIHFERAAKELLLGDSHWLLRDALKVARRQKIAIIGAGFGWIAEDWIASGLGPIVAVDTSEYLHSRLEGNAKIPVLNVDVLTPSGRAVVKAAMDGVPNLVITEDVLPTLTDEECVALSDTMRIWSGRVAHWVSVKEPENAYPLNWKTLEEWKALLPLDTFVRRGFNEVL